MKALVSLSLFLALGAGQGVRAQELDLLRSRPAAKENVTFQHNLNFEFLKPRKQGKVPLADRPFYSLSWSDWKQTIRELDQEAEGTAIRFREVAHPIILERNNVFYQRDLTATVKGIVLKKFGEGRFDLGVYRKHYQFLTGPIGYSSFSSRQMIESPQASRFSLIGGGRQVQMTFRIHLSSGARKRSLK